MIELPKPDTTDMMFRQYNRSVSRRQDQCVFDVWILRACGDRQFEKSFETYEAAVLSFAEGK